MKITYRADAPISPANVPGLGMWTAGDSAELSAENAAYALLNPNFVDESGANPNFTCRDCGAETRENAIPSPDGPIPLRDAEGLRCPACFSNPPAVAPEPAPAPLAVVDPADVLDDELRNT